MKSRSNIFSIAVIGIIAAFFTTCKMYYEPGQATFDSGNADVNEGKRLTMLTCGPCHYDPSTHQLSGMRMNDVPGILGKLYASNITQHPEKGIARYTDSQLAYLVRTGISRTGKLMPFMQRPNLADEDLKMIIAFLRSDDSLVKPADITQGETKYSPIGKMAISSSKPLDWPTKVITRPKEAFELGKYLVDNLNCYDCHSKSFAHNNKLQPELSIGYMGGGNKLLDAAGRTVFTPNLTAHETGMGNWTEADFKRAMKQGINKDKSIITFPMPMYADLTETELTSIFAYLRTIPQIDRKVKRNP